jgi:hypothetical protein
MDANEHEKTLFTEALKGREGRRRLRAKRKNRGIASPVFVGVFSNFLPPIAA